MVVQIDTTVGLRTLVARVLVANLLLIGSGFACLQYILDGPERALSYTLVFSSVLWAGLPIGVATYYRAYADVSPAAEETVRLVFWLAVAIGIIACADLILSTEETIMHSLISWEISAAAFSIAAACLAAKQLDPLGGISARLIRRA